MKTYKNKIENRITHRLCKLMRWLNVSRLMFSILFPCSSLNTVNGNKSPTLNLSFAYRRKLEKSMDNGLQIQQRI